MKALSIKQPWAWLICAGYKDVENRTWHIHMPPLLNYPATPRRIYVHASKVPDTKGAWALWGNGKLRALLPDYALAQISNLATFWHNSAIIGEVDIVGCKYHYGEENDKLYSIWHEVGMYGLLLANPVLYIEPITCKGKLGFFEPDISVSS